MRALLLFCLLFSFCLHFNAYAQKTDKVYTYSLEKNDPEHPRNLRLIILPLVVDANSSNTSLNYQFGMSYLFKNIIQLDANYQRAFFERFTTDMEPRVLSIYEDVPSNQLEVMGKIFFSKKIVKVQQGTHIKNIKGTNVSHVTSIPSNKNRLWGLRLGYMKGVSAHESPYAVYMGTNLTVPSDSVFSFTKVSNMMRYTVIPVGISLTKIIDLIVKFEEVEGLKKNHNIFELYADVLFAANLQLDNLVADMNPSDIYGTSPVYQQFEVDTKTEKSKTGFRAGLSYTGTETFGWSAGIEAGLRPGITTDSRGYAQLKFGFNLGVNAR